MHKYTPDFKVEDEYWEIKGNQFLNEDGTWRNPFGYDNGLNEAKHQYCIKNNIKILYKNDIIQYKNYFIEKYGKKFLKEIAR